MPKNKGIDVQILIERPAAEVFAAWVKPDLLERWLARKAHVEPRVGGAYELFWDPEHPEKNSTRGCRITELVPDAELGFEWKGQAEFAKLVADHTRVTIRLEPRDGSTYLRLSHSGWRAGLAWDKARKWQADAWKEAVENLKNMLENMERFLRAISLN